MFLGVWDIRGWNSGDWGFDWLSPVFGDVSVLDWYKDGGLAVDGSVFAGRIISGTATLRVGVIARIWVAVSSVLPCRSITAGGASLWGRITSGERVGVLNVRHPFG
jgi:hypothetical protein